MQHARNIRGSAVRQTFRANQEERRVRAATREACAGPFEMKAAAPGQFVALRAIHARDWWMLVKRREAGRAPAYRNRTVFPVALTGGVRYAAA